MTIIKEKKIKVLIAVASSEGSDRSAKVMTSILKEAGMEVIYLGRSISPESIIETAIDEDVDVIGINYPSGEHLVFTPKIVEEIKKNKIEDIILITGGIFPAEDILDMEKMGANKAFKTESYAKEIVAYIRKNVNVNE